MMKIGNIFKHAFVSDRIEDMALCESFKKIEAKYIECKNVCIKLKNKRNKIEKLEELRNTVISLLEQERNLWKRYIEQGNVLKMKKEFIEETPE